MFICIYTRFIKRISIDKVLSKFWLKKSSMCFSVKKHKCHLIFLNEFSLKKTDVTIYFLQITNYRLDDLNKLVSEHQYSEWAPKSRSKYSPLQAFLRLKFATSNIKTVAVVLLNFSIRSYKTINIIIYWNIYTSNITTITII